MAVLTEYTSYTGMCMDFARTLHCKNTGGHLRNEGECCYENFLFRVLGGPRNCNMVSLWP